MQFRGGCHKGVTRYLLDGAIKFQILFTLLFSYGQTSFNPKAVWFATHFQALFMYFFQLIKRVSGSSDVCKLVGPVLALCVMSQSLLALSQTSSLVCTGTKSVSSASVQIAQWESFQQTYVFQNGKLNNSAPSIFNDNLLSFQLTPSDDAECTKFCNHRVIFNAATGTIFDVNHSFEKKVQHLWEFKGKCRVN